MMVRGRRSTVLVVEDDPVARAVMVRTAAEFSEVCAVATGEEAIALLHAGTPPDVVLCDVQLPGVDGAQVMAQLRTLAPEATRIAVSGTVDARAAMSVVNDGHPFRFLNKPLDPDTLRRTMEEALAKREATGVRRADVARLSAQLERADRLATLGGLAHGAGHELNNIAQVLTAAVELIEMGAAAPGDPEILEQLQHVSRHLTHHAQSLLHLGRPQPCIPTWIDVGKVVGGALESMQHVGRLKRVRLAFEAPESPIHLLAVRTRIEQVILNLVGNAADAACDVVGRVVTVTVRVLHRAHHVVIEVADDASGIPESLLGRIFEPYVTTKAEGAGTGLGLAIVRSIVDDARGRITVESALGVGTTFRVELPTD